MPRGSKAQLEIFAQALAAGNKPAEAAKIAKYRNSKSFASNARKRAQRADVKAMVAELRKPALDAIAEAIKVDVDWATKHHLAVIKKANLFAVGPADYQRSLDAIAKLHGLYAPEKREVTGKGGVPLLDLTKLTDEQLAILEQIYLAAGIDLDGDAESGAGTPPIKDKPH